MRKKKKIKTQALCSLLHVTRVEVMKVPYSVEKKNTEISRTGGEIELRNHVKTKRLSSLNC